MSSSLRIIYNKQRSQAPGFGLLLVVYVKNATPNREDDYNCDVDKFFQGSEEFSTINCQTLLYQYSTYVNDTFRWQDLLDTSFDLLEQLLPFCTASKDVARPLVFISEGLGGLVIKQALWNARKQLYRYRDFLEQVSGIVFLITPHCGKNEVETATKLGVILRQYSKAAGQKAVSQDFLKPYEICAHRFEELGLNCPILSIYETESSRYRSSRLMNRKSILAVDDAFATTHCEKERLLGLDVPLKQLMDPDAPSQTRRQIIGFIQELHGMAQARLHESSQESSSYPVRIPSMKTPTPAPSLAGIQTSSDSSRKQSTSTRDPVLLTPPPRDSSTPVSGSGGTASSSSFQLVESIAGLAVEPRRIKLPCYFTKPHARNRTFFLRPDVMSLLEAHLLVSADDPSSFARSLKTFVLCGIGGLGKTEMAIEFVFSYMKSFDAVFIFHADQASTLAEEFSRAAMQLGLQQNSGADPQDNRELLKEWFADPRIDLPQGPSNQQFAKWLILFDNVDDPDVLTQYWPTAGIGSVLVTTRNPMAKTDFFFGEVGHELQTLSIKESVLWILQLSEADSKDRNSLNAAEMIATKLDGLPLAIVQIISIMRMRQLKLTEFVKLYESETELAELQPIRVGNARGYEHSLASVWALENLEPRPLVLLGVISMLDPDRIQESILKSPLQKTYGLQYPLDPREYHVDLTPLLQSSLVHRNSDNAELSIHRLVTDVARENFLKKSEFLEYFHIAVDLVANNWPFNRVRTKIGGLHNVTRWDKCANLYPHIERLFKRFNLARKHVQSLAQFERFALLIQEAAWYQTERGNFESCDPLLNLAEEIYSQIEPQSFDELSALSSTRAAILRYKDNGEEALFHDEKSLQLAKEACLHSGEPSADLSYALHGVGCALKLCKLYTKAIQYFEQAIVIRKSLPGYQPIHEYGCIYQIGICQFGLAQFKDSEITLRQTIALWESVKGSHDLSSFRPAPSYFTLGHALASQGVLDESFQCHDRALKHLLATVGHLHIFTAPACVSVAGHLLRRGETREAQNLFDQAIRIYQKHPVYVEDLAMVHFLYGQMLERQGATAAAGAPVMFERAAYYLNQIYPHSKRDGRHLREEEFSGLGTIGLG